MNERDAFEGYTLLYRHMKITTETDPPETYDVWVDGTAQKVTLIKEIDGVPVMDEPPEVLPLDDALFSKRLGPYTYTIVATASFIAHPTPV